MCVRVHGPMALCAPRGDRHQLVAADGSVHIHPLGRGLKSRRQERTPNRVLAHRGVPSESAAEAPRPTPGWPAAAQQPADPSGTPRPPKAPRSPPSQAAWPAGLARCDGSPPTAVPAPQVGRRLGHELRCRCPRRREDSVTAGTGHPDHPARRHQRAGAGNTEAGDAAKHAVQVAGPIPLARCLMATKTKASARAISIRDRGARSSRTASSACAPRPPQDDRPGSKRLDGRPRRDDVGQTHGPGAAVAAIGASLRHCST